MRQKAELMLSGAWTPWSVSRKERMGVSRQSNDSPTSVWPVIRSKFIPEARQPRSPVLLSLPRRGSPRTGPGIGMRANARSGSRNPE